MAGLVFSLALGAAAGLGGYTFVYAKGYSYLSSDPMACNNCHVMNEQYDAWTRSSHHAVATCNDCHIAGGAVSKWVTKASNGYHHSLAFTTGDFQDPIQIKPGNRAVTEARCRACHQDIVHAVDTLPAEGDELSCVRCHRNVGHLH
jgi:cytochrome c nitrite reductase small subunit